MAEITLHNVSLSYAGHVRAVHELDLDIHPGELMVLVGPSGCGKTTTLRLIAGLETPDQGEIRIDGHLVNRLAPPKRNVSMVFQDFALYPHLTARKNMVYVLKLRGVARDEIAKRIEWAADITRIRDLLERKPGELSGGERQRVALAVAFVRKPACHLLDEPLSNLDALTRRRLRTELKTIHRTSGATILHVTHDQEEAMSLGQRIAIMNRGRIHQVGTPGEVYRSPADRFVAGFLGTPPMNFIEGELQADNGCVLFRDGQGIELPLPNALKTHLGQLGSNKVVYGIRPEHFRIGESLEPRMASISARVMAIEPLGGWLDIHVNTAAGSALIARVPAESMEIAVDDSIKLGFDPNRAHLFEADEKGLRISDANN